MPAHDPNAEPPARGAVTVRGLAPALKARLRVRAAHNARSMEAEARATLEAALAEPAEETTDLASFARGLFGPIGAVELELPPGEPAREPPDFGAGPDGTPTVAEPSPKSNTGTRRR
jgi:antitoxin FitA